MPYIGCRLQLLDYLLRTWMVEASQPQVDDSSKLSLHMELDEG